MKSVKPGVLLLFAGISWILVSGGRFAFLQLEARRQDHLTNELCKMVGNYLETGSLREAYEGLYQGLKRLGKGGECISLLDNGRSFAPACVDPTRRYHTATCKAEGNQGIRADVHFPESPIFDRSIVGLWILLTLFFFGLGRVLELFVSYFTTRITLELQERLFGETPDKSSSKLTCFGQWVDWALLKTGVQQRLKNQIEEFEHKIKASEFKARQEAALRAVQQAQAQKSEEFLEHIRQIRHDIRSPLSSLLSLQEALESDELIQESLGSSIRQIQLMIDDMEDLDIGNERHKPGLVIAEVIAAEAFSQHRLRFGRAKQIQLTFSFNATHLSPIHVDPAQMRRILDNLFENAFDAVPNQGMIQLKVLSNESTCEITVEDNGLGIPESATKDLFSRGGTFGKVNGIGLGLYQCKKYIESWKGKIGFERLQQGTRFKLNLPLIQTGVAFVGLPEGQCLSIIDDEDFVSDSLETKGYQILERAQTYDDGNRLLKNRKVDGTPVLVDYRLDNDQLGTELIAKQSNRTNLFLCTNDFDNPKVIKKSKEIGLRIIPKPLCFLDRSVI